jgi:hypothetical protein
MNYKYNPGFSSDAELIDSFVVRQGELRQILQTLEENIGRTYQHLLVIGARGTGKTMLVRRVAIEVGLSPNLSRHWYPLIFGEESYKILSAGEFWLEALEHLAVQNPGSHWRSTWEELREEKDDRRLHQRALAQLMDFADRQGKQILLIVENLNMLFDEQMKAGDDWDLRHTLQNEPRLMLLGTATQRFDEIDNVDKAWFEFFALHTLESLPLEECRLLWQSVTREALSQRQIRPMQILTGGNPRLLRMLAEFAKGMGFQDLMGNLTQLIDSHTDYFKSLLENLPATERKVFVELLELWRPANTNEVAKAARLEVNKTSSLLNRLLNRGAIEVVEVGEKKKYYQVSERLFNIYYLMRRRGTTSDLVRATVEFMCIFYVDISDLLGQGRDIIKEAVNLLPSERTDHIKALLLLIDRFSFDTFEDFKNVDPAKKELLDLIHGAFPQSEIEQIEFGYQIADLMKLENQNINDWKLTAENFEEEYDRLKESLWDDFFSGKKGMQKTIDREIKWLSEASTNLDLAIIWKCLARLYKDINLSQAREDYIKALKLEQNQQKISYSLWIEVLNFFYCYKASLNDLEDVLSLSISIIDTKEFAKMSDVLQRKFIDAFTALVFKTVSVGLSKQILHLLTRSQSSDRLKKIANAISFLGEYNNRQFLRSREMYEIENDIDRLEEELYQRSLCEIEGNISLDSMTEDEIYKYVSPSTIDNGDYITDIDLQKLIEEDITGEFENMVMKSHPHVNARMILLCYVKGDTLSDISRNFKIPKRALYSFSYDRIFQLLRKLLFNNGYLKFAMPKHKNYFKTLPPKSCQVN